MSYSINCRSLLTAGRRLSIALALVAAAGCGGGDDDSPAQTVEPEDFVGTWSYKSGQLRIECPGAPAITIDMAGAGETERIELGTESDLIVLDQDGECPLALNLEGNRAVAAAGQSCSYIDEDGEHVTETLMSYSFTLSGSTAQETGQMTVDMVESGATCGASMNAGLEKL